MQDVALRPKTVTYNNVLNACGFAGHPGDDPDEIVEIATTVFEEAKSTCGCNYITYAAFLRVVSTFVRDGAKRWDMTRDVVRQSCEAGQLSRFVLSQARYAVTPVEYAMLKSEVMDQKTGKIRPEYSVNARKSRNTPSKKTAFVN